MAKSSVKKKKRTLARVRVKKANSLVNPLDEFCFFRTYTRNDLQVEFECKRVRDLPQQTLAWIITLMEVNMKKMYEECEWGWNALEKEKELTEDTAWYLIAYLKETHAPVAFSHFRFVLDFGVEVLYVYELQLESSVQRKGIGKFMLRILELIAFKNNMKKVMMTVLKHNESALAFYKKMHYTIDETCPADTKEKQFCYYILSKFNKKIIG